MAQIARARNGNEVAWTTLVKTHQTPAFRLAYLILGNEHDAQDVVQDAFVQAYRALDGFDESRPLRPWLLRITRNLAYNRQRALRRYWRTLNQWLSGQPPQILAAHPDPAECTDQQAQAELLWQAVQRLKPQDQEVLYLRYFLELSVSEAADALGVAEGTVKSRLHRALARLKELVEREYPMLKEALIP